MPSFPITSPANKEEGAPNCPALIYFFKYIWFILFSKLCYLYREKSITRAVMWKSSMLPRLSLQPKFVLPGATTVLSCSQFSCCLLLYFSISGICSYFWFLHFKNYLLTRNYGKLDFSLLTCLHAHFLPTKHTYLSRHRLWSSCRSFGDSHCWVLIFVWP